MATTRSLTHDLIKTAKLKVDHVHKTLLEIKDEVARELTSDRIQQLYVHLGDLRDLIVNTMSLVDKGEKEGNKVLPIIDLATTCLIMITELTSELDSKAVSRSLSLPTRYENDGDRISSVYTSGLVTPKHFGRNLEISDPTTTVFTSSVKTVHTEMFSTPESLPNTRGFIARSLVSRLFSRPKFLDLTAPKTTRKSDFNLFQQPSVTFTTNYEVPIIHSTINPLTSGYVLPTTTIQSQTGFDRGISEPVFSKPFSMKWADKVQKFDGEFENFHAFLQAFNHFIHHTDAENAGKLLLLREKLDPFSLGLIAGIDGPQYNQAYQVLVKYYSASFPLQQKLKAKVENLCRAEYWHQTDIMRSNLAVIKDVYNTLSTSGNNRSFLETDFFYIVAAKFPYGAVTNIMQRYGAELTISKYLNDIVTYIEQSEQQRIILCKTDYVMNLNNSKQETFDRTNNAPTRYNFNRPNYFRRTNFQNKNRISNSPQSRQELPAITYPNSRFLSIAFDTPTTSRNNNNNESVQSSTRISEVKQCFFCKGDHRPSHCPRPSAEKIRILNTLKRCLKCFSTSHVKDECIQTFNCRSCSGNHNTSICLSRDKDNNPITSTLISVPTKIEKIKIELNGKEFQGLFDTGSAFSFIGYDICDALQVTPEPCDDSTRQVITWTTIIGKVNLITKIGQIMEEHQYYILPQVQYIIIGLDLIDRFNIVRVPGGRIEQLLENNTIPIDM